MIRQAQTIKMTEAPPARVDEPTIDRGPIAFKFDRRFSRRYPVSGRVTVHRRDHDAETYQHPICSIQLENLSHGGLCALSSVALRPHEIVTVLLPPHGGEQALDMHGHVIRCDPVGAGYEIAIKFDINQAA